MYTCVRIKKISYRVYHPCLSSLLELVINAPRLRSHECPFNPYLKLITTCSLSLCPPLSSLSLPQGTHLGLVLSIAIISIPVNEIIPFHSDIWSRLLQKIYASYRVRHEYVRHARSEGALLR